MEKVLERDQKLSELDDRAGTRHLEIQFPLYQVEPFFYIVVMLDSLMWTY